MAGDSGSLVVDARTGNIYGHIVSGDPTSSLAYIVSAYEVFDDIEKRFGARPSLPARIQQEPDRAYGDQGKLLGSKAERASLSKASKIINTSSEETVDTKDLWTEIHKGSVSADAIKDTGWKYKETKDSCYMMEDIVYVCPNSFD